MSLFDCISTRSRGVALSPPGARVICKPRPWSISVGAALNSQPPHGNYSTMDLFNAHSTINVKRWGIRVTTCWVAAGKVHSHPFSFMNSTMQPSIQLLLLSGRKSAEPLQLWYFIAFRLSSTQGHPGSLNFITGMIHNNVLLCSISSNGVVLLTKNSDRMTGL